jgi:hypothetical protein
MFEPNVVDTGAVEPACTWFAMDSWKPELIVQVACVARELGHLPLATLRFKGTRNAS